jgi:hypothetical protein
MNNRQKLTDKIREWYNWLTTHVPSSIRKGVSNAFDNMRKKVLKLYNSSKEEEDKWYDAKENFSDEDEKWYDVKGKKVRHQPQMCVRPSPLPGYHKR